MCKKTTSESYKVRVGKEKEAYRILKSDLLYVEIFFSRENAEFVVSCLGDLYYW